VKILYVNTFAERKGHGGAEETLWTLMSAMRDAGHQCILLATSNQHGLRRSDQDGITVWNAGIRNLYWPGRRKQHNPFARAAWHLQDSYNPWMQSYVREVARTEQPDVASLHNLPGWSVATWTTLRRLSIPTIQVLHDHYLICPRSTMFKNGRNCAGQCRNCAALRLPHRAPSGRLSAVVGVSRYILEAHRRLGYFEGVPFQRVIRDTRNIETLGCQHPTFTTPHSGTRFGYIGTLAATKGVSELVDAFLRAAIPYSELWIAGSGNPEYEHRLRVHANGSSHIRFLGRVLAAEFYPQVDAVVVPSICNDNLPGVVYEAFAFGKAVIGSRRGGIPEMIRDGENGLLFEPDRPDELCNAMRRLNADESLRKQLVAGATRAAPRYLDVRGWAAQYTHIYDEAVQTSR